MIGAHQRRLSESSAKGAQSCSFERTPPAGRTAVGFFFISTPDLPALRTQLSSAGVEVGSIAHPDHMRSGEMCLKDPDGYVILIGHWGKPEHDAWEQQREKKRAAGVDPAIVSVRVSDEHVAVKITGTS
jgi:hypothetical protein